MDIKIDDSHPIIKMEDSFKELQNYSDSQFHTIATLNEQIARLKSENQNLQKMLEGNLPLLEFSNGLLGISNEQLICETQITILKNKACLGNELTSDEVRRFTQLFEVLEKIKKAAPDQDDISVRKMTDEELLKIVTTNEPK